MISGSCKTESVLIIIKRSYKLINNSLLREALQIPVGKHDRLPCC